MRRKKFMLAVGVTLAALALVAPTAVADPVGPPIPRPLSGGGSGTTQDLMNALAERVGISGVKQIGSYNTQGAPDPYTTKAGCSIPRGRTNGSTNGTNALQDALEGVADVTGTGGVPCLDFARSTALNPASFPSNPPGGPGRLSWIPLAVDAVTYATRDDSQIPGNLTRAELQAIYSCQFSTDVFRPVLPPVGSDTRNFWLTALGNPSLGPCINVDFPGGTAPPENRGNALTDPRQIMPYSIPVYQTQIWGPATNVAGRAILRTIEGVRPKIRNSDLYPDTAPNTIVTRNDSQLPDLTRTDQRAIYIDCAFSTDGVRPVLPAPGPVRTQFLNAIGVPAAQQPNFEATHPCINVDFPNRVGPPENQGNALTDARQLMPHSIDSYLAQLWGPEPDLRGRAVLRQVTGIDNFFFRKPTVLNTAFPFWFRRDVYNVIPTSRETTDPWSTVFVDSDPSTVNTALICQTVTIQDQGFGTAANCGSIVGRSP